MIAKRALTLTVAALATAVTACAAAVPSASAAVKAVTITYVLQGPLTGPTGTMWKQMAAQFNKQYAPIKIQLIPESQAQIEATELTSVKSANPPDMIYWPVGAGYGETTAAAEHLLANLLPLYKKEGWLKVMPSSMVEEEVNGGLYNVDGQLGAQPYVFYNKTVFNKLHLSPPTTAAGFVPLAHKLKAAGYIPMAFGTVHQWPAVHLMSILTERLLSKQAYYNLEYSWEPSIKRPTSWTTPAVVAAFATLQKWAKAGLFESGSSSLTNGEAQSVFESGKAAMTSCPIGCYPPAAIKQYIGSRFAVGMFQYPQMVKSIPTYQNVAVANGEFSVPEKAWVKNKQAITDWIEFYMSKQARTDMVVTAGLLPDDTSGLSSALIAKNVGPFAAKVSQWITKYGTEQNLDGWLAAPLKALVAVEAQDVIAGTATPAQACARLQAEAAGLHSGKIAA